MRLLSREDLRREKGIGYSAVHLWRLVQAGKFPRQVKIGDRNLWPEPEIDAFIELLIAKRNGSNRRSAVASPGAGADQTNKNSEVGAA